MAKNNLKCPNCNASHYSPVGGTVSTLMYFQPTFKDGVNINPDRNARTTRYKCVECKHEFVVTIKGNEVRYHLTPTDSCGNDKGVEGK